MGDEPTDEREAEGESVVSDLFTIYEAAKYLSTARHTLERYALRGRLPYVLSGAGSLLFHRADLDRVGPLIEANREKYNTEQGASKRRKKTEGE